MKPKPDEAVPKELDAIADIVLAYKPKPKSAARKKRKKIAKRLAASASSEVTKVVPERKKPSPDNRPK